MKYKTTRRELVNGKAKFCLFSVGYCGLQGVLRGVPARAYSAGSFGWNFDVYEIDDPKGGDLTICTGYRGMPGFPLPYEFTDKWEKKAEKIALLPWEKRGAAQRRLLRNFALALHDYGNELAAMGK